MEILDEYGTVILTGDSNSRMSSYFIDKTEGKKNNTHGRSWIKVLRKTTWRPLPNAKKCRNTWTYTNKSGSRGIPDHFIMHLNYIEGMVVYTNNWEITGVLPTYHTLMEVHLSCNPSGSPLKHKIKEDWKEYKKKKKT